ncbi:hypothetical protein Mal64_21920 [Pseudobythopirellula maris]|uniref:DUF1570 domain-containing protein n=1 Tax=Pseudobythopirellula maris TaxID=2527991 RepID=A0A5C5ZMK2_9BACT|nr:DUF1570 domain-containing protein [Pseudobythopirellula maris]TWT88704.1 hypothetical protein Mal64_21920 [Pseudobythopirellula maris]
MPPKPKRRLALAPRGALFALLAAAAASSPAAEFMFSAKVDGRRLEGRPLTWTETSIALLGRDGALYEFAAKQALEPKKTAPTFRGYTSQEMRRALEEEFDGRFGFTSTSHYLVAHPRGDKAEWAQRFEDLYRSLVAYFRVRGFTPREPDYPLVAVVFANRSDYRSYVQESSVATPQGALGHYEPKSNRVYLYDQKFRGDDWAENAATVIHEATHQTAYNTGLHRRFTVTPRWVAEGLAMMFEARGVYDPRGYDTQTQRLNWGRLIDFREMVVSTRSPGKIAAFIASDQSFERNTLPAYAQAWALSFFLCETRPQEYSRYLATTARRPLFAKYPPAQRVADFREAFGDDLELLDAQFMSYIARLR